MANDEPSEVNDLFTFARERHPYLHNIFALLGVDPDAGQEDFVRQVQRTEQRLRASGGALKVNGRELQEADLARADYLTSREEAFAAERLLAHTSHRIDIDSFRALLTAINAAKFPEPQELLPLPLADPSCLTDLLPPIPAPEPQAVLAPDLNLLRAEFAPRREEELGILF